MKTGLRKILAVTAFAVLVLAVLTLSGREVDRVKPGTNETLAVASLKAIAAAEGQYKQAYPAQGFSCSLAALGGVPGGGTPTSDAAQILDPRLARGMKAGYLFTFEKCTKTTADGREISKGYEVTAVPVTVGKTGNRGFCMEEGGNIEYDPNGGTDCTVAVY